MSIFAPIVNDTQYEEVFCLKSMSIFHADIGNIEVKEGESYQCYIGENLDEWSPQGFLIKVGAFLWPFDKKNFGTLRQLREIKLSDLGL